MGAYGDARWGWNATSVTVRLFKFLDYNIWFCSHKSYVNANILPYIFEHAFLNWDLEADPSNWTLHKVYGRESDMALSNRTTETMYSCMFVVSWLNEPKTCTTYVSPGNIHSLGHPEVAISDFNASKAVGINHHESSLRFFFIKIHLEIHEHCFSKTTI
jgi:hypothetical protein